MIKHILLLSALVLALPVAAAQVPGADCQSVKESSAITMAKYYSLRPSSISVTIKNVYKPVGSSDVTSHSESTYGDSVCVMEWVEVFPGCGSLLKYMSCKPEKDMKADKIRDERIRTVFHDFPRVEKKPEPEKPSTNAPSPDAS
jgi:hypothetical protein